MSETARDMEKPRPRTAVALGGSSGMRAVPKVLAAGRGEMARHIVDWAKKSGLRVEKNSDLAEVLQNLDLGDSIPEEVFMAVAEILYYVYEINASIKEQREPRFSPVE